MRIEKKEPTNKGGGEETEISNQNTVEEREDIARRNADMYYRVLPANLLAAASFESLSNDLKAVGPCLTPEQISKCLPILYDVMIAVGKAASEMRTHYNLRYDDRLKDRDRRGKYVQAYALSLWESTYRHFSLGQWWSSESYEYKDNPFLKLWRELQEGDARRPWLEIIPGNPQNSGTENRDRLVYHDHIMRDLNYLITRPAFEKGVEDNWGDGKDLKKIETSW
jgi:hypothetical protein